MAKVSLQAPVSVARQRVAALLVVIAAWSWLFASSARREQDEGNGTRPPPAVGPSYDEAHFDQEALTRSLVDPEPTSDAQQTVAAPVDDALLPVKLRVLDDATGFDLTEVQVVRVKDHRHLTVFHPGDFFPDEVVVEHGGSPLCFPSVGGWHLVRAPGFAWQGVLLNSSGEPVVRLARGGDLEVTVTGGAFPPEAKLRCWTEADLPPDAGSGLQQRLSGPMARIEIGAAGKGLTRITGLEAGKWFVALELGRYGRARRLGCTQVEVVAGGTSVAAVVIPGDVDRPPSVPVAGILHVHEAWRVDPEGILIEPIGELGCWEELHRWIRLDEMTRLRAGEYSFEAGHLMPGGYVLSVTGCGYTTHCAIGSQGAKDLRIDVPAPADVCVQVVDDDTGNVILGASVSRTATIDGQEGGMGFDGVAPGPDGSVRFQAAPGSIMVSVHADGFCSFQETREVMAGNNHFLLRLQPGCGIDVVLKSGEETLPWKDEYDAFLVGDGTFFSGLSRSGNRFAAFWPGAYAVELSGLGDYEQVVTPKVKLTPGKWTRVEVEVRSRH